MNPAKQHKKLIKYAAKADKCLSRKKRRSSFASGKAIKNFPLRMSISQEMDRRVLNYMKDVNMGIRQD